MKRALALLIAGALAMTADAQDLLEKVKHNYADNGGVKIHYAELGEGPAVLMIHGFPDFWYSWRNQMPALAENHRVLAMDLRGYNESGQPEGQENYDMALLVADAAAVIEHAGVGKAAVVGHDWGGMVSWGLAAARPDLVEKLVILNLPYPTCLSRELANNPEQQANAAYARGFQTPGSELLLSGAFLAGIVAPKDEAARKVYIEAFNKSSFAAMMNCYRQNYPKEPYTETAFPRITMPVLQFHGLDDKALHADALNNTWKYLDSSWTLVTVPGASHWVHHDKPEVVTQTMVDWLKR